MKTIITETELKTILDIANGDFTEAVGMINRLIAKRTDVTKRINLGIQEAIARGREDKFSPTLSHTDQLDRGYIKFVPAPPFTNTLKPYACQENNTAKDSVDKDSY